MILADTSIVIDFFRGADPTLQRILIDEPAAICGITRSEALHGARSPQERATIFAGLDLFKQISIVDSDWDEVGDLLASLRSAGIAVPMADAVIASVAMSRGLALWTRDAQFGLIQRVVPKLQLFVP
jgi:predicted nucleic acid-binding protein